ncbi:TPA: DUF1617 family protein, partial [Streptococcus pyogenes]|nr:DUF1617 family protein [Streptococcus pyogenes]HES5047854.1 DUF1617 family protein [Streptococcus pyogenes]
MQLTIKNKDLNTLYCVL